MPGVPSHTYVGSTMSHGERLIKHPQLLLRQQTELQTPTVARSAAYTTVCMSVAWAPGLRVW